MIRQKAILLMFLVLGAWGMAFAHPHVFVDASVIVQFNENGLTGVKNRWVYDELYSTAMMSSVDADKDGVLSNAEIQQLQKNTIGQFADNNYYNYVVLGSSFLKAEKVSNFTAKYEKKRLVLEFEVGFTAGVKKDYTMLVVVVSDPSNYILMTTDMENADVDAPESLDVDFFNDDLKGLTLFRAFKSKIEGLYLRYKK